MLLKIREKSQGLFAWFILGSICIPFALWGINNYLKGGSETVIASVNSKDFYQNDVDRAYAQYSQSFAGMNIDEETLKKQSLNKLIKDEVLLQHVQKQRLVVTDEDARDFIASLEYFQVNGKFSKEQYQTLLNAQNISSAEFVNRIKKSQVMEQFQRSISESDFATPYEVNNFFKLQNQEREIEYLTVSLKPVTTAPTEEEINAYYQKQQQQFQIPEQVSVDYIALSLDDLAKEVKVTDEQLKAYYEKNKAQYGSKERRKISHILFAFNKDTDDKAALAKATAAQEALKNKAFEALAAEISDDKATAKNGGDLGLFEVGVMEKAFEEAAQSLKLGEVSQPVKSAYGYHLIKVTELIPAQTKPFEEVRAEITKAYQRKEAEASFYALNDKLGEVNYENPDNLTAVADSLNLAVQKTTLFTKDAGEGIANEAAVRKAAFSEEVLKGNNSDPIELGKDKIVVLHLLEHKAASVRELKEVKDQVITALLAEKSKQQAVDTAAELKKQLLAGQNIQTLATANQLELKKIEKLSRKNAELPWQITEAVFKAAKPTPNKPTILTVALQSGQQVVISLNKVIEGTIEADKKQQEMIGKNIAKASGDSTFDAVINSLQDHADVKINIKAQQ